MSYFGQLKYDSGSTITAIAINDAGQIWSGSAWVEASSLANTAAWQALLVTCTETTLTDSTGTGVYVTSDLTDAAPCTVYYYAGSSPLPTDAAIAAGMVGPVEADEVTLATSQPNYAPAKAGDEMTLTSDEHGDIAAEVNNYIPEV
jgi:hypothetical protein